MLGVVLQVNALCRDKLGEYCHRGATTQDITDTVTAMQTRDGLAIIDGELTAISAAMVKLAWRRGQAGDGREADDAD